MQADHYKSFLEPELRRLGYDGVYKQKTREAMGQEGKVDGCAIFYKRDRFVLQETHALEFNHVAITRAKNFSNPTALPALLKDNVALVAVLDLLTPHGLAAASRFCVVTTHVYQNKDYPNVKLWQVQTLVRELEKFTVCARV